MYRISVSLCFLLLWQFNFAFGTAGRPHNRNMIVDNVRHDIPIIKLKALSVITSDASTTFEFLASYGLVDNSMYCTRCDMATVYSSSRSDSVDGKYWHCSLRKCRTSTLVDSFFSRVKLSTIMTVVDLMYSRSIDVQQSWTKSVCLATQSLIGITTFEKYAADTSLTTLYNLVSLAPWTYREMPGTLVEIDESKFFQHKYHRGVPGPGRWVLGMVQRNSRQCCLVQVPDRHHPSACASGYTHSDGHVGSIQPAAESSSGEPHHPCGP